MRPHQLKNINKNQLSSPCVRMCCLDEDDICLGCFRSLDEIKNWTQVDGQTREHFLVNAKNREQQYQQK